MADQVESPGAHAAALQANRGDDAHAVAVTSVARGESALSPVQRTLYVLLWVLWIVVVVRFWLFWGDPEHRGVLALYIPATLAFAYLLTGLPTIYWFYVGRMRRPVPVAAPEGLRVAMVTLCVPSHESIDVIERQLRSLVAVRYPHDSWVLDEGGDPEVERLAAARSACGTSAVRASPRYNQPGPPFKAKTKAGNVNAWLDAHGADYDYFVQLDIDHRPRPRYLETHARLLRRPGGRRGSRLRA